MFQYNGAYYCQNHIADALREDTFNECIVDRWGVVHSDITFVEDTDEPCDTCEYQEFIARKEAHFEKNILRRDYGI